MQKNQPTVVLLSVSLTLTLTYDTEAASSRQQLWRHDEASVQADMSVNSSDSLPHFYHCLDSSRAVFIFASFTCAKTLLVLPLSVFVLHLGHQRWRQQRSTTSTSHSDFFCYHVASMELINVASGAVYLCGSYAQVPTMEQVGFYFSYMVIPGEIFFHVLTCVERYLAVVHPVIYLGLRRSGGLRIRNISVGCVWLLSLGWIGMAVLYRPDLPTVAFFCFLVVCLMVVSLCSLRVLCVLIRPRPGDVGGTREQVDQSKQRAFHTILAIMGVLWLWFVGLLVCIAVDVSQSLSYSEGCVVLMSGMWFNLPSALVLPLLFLHRAGKLLCCRYSSE